MKVIYIKPSFAGGALKVSEPTEPFKSVAHIAGEVLHIDPAMIGTEDIEIAMPELQDLQQALENDLVNRIADMEKDKHPDAEVFFMGKKLKLNIRNHQHRLIDSLIRIYNMTGEEIKTSGCLHIYNLSALDNTNTYLMMALKAHSSYDTIEFYYHYFLEKYMQYETMSFQEFEDRINQLVADNFIATRQLPNNVKTIGPSRKTGDINL